MWQMQQKKQSYFWGQSIPKDSSVNILLQITIKSEVFYILSLIYHKSGLRVAEAHCLPLCLTFTGLCKVLSQPVYLLLEHIISLSYIHQLVQSSVHASYIHWPVQSSVSVFHIDWPMQSSLSLSLYVFVSHIPWPVQSSISLSLTFIGLCKVLYESVSYIRWPVQSFYLSLSYVHWPE